MIGCGYHGLCQHQIFEGLLDLGLVLVVAPKQDNYDVKNQVIFLKDITGVLGTDMGNNVDHGGSYWVDYVF